MDSEDIETDDKIITITPNDIPNIFIHEIKAGALDSKIFESVYLSLYDDENNNITKVVVFENNKTGDDKVLLLNPSKNYHAVIEYTLMDSRKVTGTIAKLTGNSTTVGKPDCYVTIKTSFEEDSFVGLKGIQLVLNYRNEKKTVTLTSKKPTKTFTADYNDTVVEMIHVEKVELVKTDNTREQFFPEVTQFSNRTDEYVLDI